MGEKNVFFFWPNTDGKYSDPEVVPVTFRRFTIDPASDDLQMADPQILGPYQSEFPRFDERYTGKDYKHTYLNVMINDKFAWDEVGTKMGGGFMFFNTIADYNHKTNEWRFFNVGRTSTVQEPIFIPRSAEAPQDDGFIMAVVNRHETFSTDLIILDTRDWTKPRAVIHMPCKLRLGIHGNWVDASERNDQVPINGTNGYTNGASRHIGGTTNGH